MAFATPFLLYLLCSYGTAAMAEVMEVGMRGDIFHRARVPSTVISTKIRQRLAIVPVSATLLPRLPHIVRQFFSPQQNASPPMYARYVRHDFYISTNSE